MIRTTNNPLKLERVKFQISSDHSLFQEKLAAGANLYSYKERFNNLLFKSHLGYRGNCPPSKFVKKTLVEINFESVITHLD